MSKKSNRISPEVRERAVRIVKEHRGEYPWLWAAVQMQFVASPSDFVATSVFLGSHRTGKGWFCELLRQVMPVLALQGAH